METKFAILFCAGGPGVTLLTHLRSTTKTGTYLNFF